MKTILFSFLLIASLTSCNEDELFVEPDIVENTENTENTEDTNTTTNVNASTPCDFSLSDAKANDTVIINCMMDLDGKTINLPENVTLVYEGGDIINGTINFSAGSVLDGKFLNSSLTIAGTNPSVKDPVFNFDPNRWEIVEGKTTSEVAQKNNDILEGTMFMVKELGVTTFKIDAMDAYFEVSKITGKTNFYHTREAVNVPSDFNLVMTDNTHLRVFPNNAPKYALLAVRDENNVTITGGNLYGDRDEHDYSSGGTHEWGHVLALRSAVNVVIDGIYLANGAGDGIDINSEGFAFLPDSYKPSNNIIIKNCVLDRNRRNNMSITDGYNITVIDNQFLNASINTQYSKGIAPGFGIDVEAGRTRDENGDLKYYQIAKDIKILNNIEKGSRRGAFTVHIGYDVTIEGNTTENSLSYSYATGTKIINNTLIGNGGGTGIKGGKKLETADSIYDNEISGNTITGFNTGINVQNRDVLVYNNIIKDFRTGIAPINLKNSKIYNNKMTSDREGSRGFFINRTELDNVVFEGNEIKSVGNSIKISNTNVDNKTSSYNVIFKNNEFNSYAYAQIKESKGITFENNTFNHHGIQVYDSQFIQFQENKINTLNHDGIHLRDVNKNINILSNRINVATNKNCIRIDSSTNHNEINDTNNNCL